MSFQSILYDSDEGIATITLNRPESLNAVTSEMRRELADAVFRAGDEARALILTGAGRGFCAGQDLGNLDAPEKGGLQRLLAEEYHPILTAIVESPIPVLCAVNGVAAGAGVNLALAADVVIAARSAAFLEAFARIGLMPDAGGTYWLPRLIGPARAMGMCLFADPVPAETAAEWGLIWEAVEDDMLQSRALDLARRLAAGPALAYRAMRRALRESATNDFSGQLALEAELQGELGQSRDFMEGTVAFLSNRKPVFEGR